jgi:MFS family permease
VRLRRSGTREPWIRDLPREVAVLVAIAFCVALGFGIVAPVIPVFARTFDVSIFEASAVISVFALMRFVTAPLAGALVNRSGERLILAGGLGIVAVSSAAAGLSQSFNQLLIFRGLGGLGSSMFTVSAMAVLLRVVSSDQRGRASSLYQGGFLLGGVAGPAVGGLVVAWSIRAPFFVYAFTLLLALLVTVIFLSRARLQEREEQVAGGDSTRMEALIQALRNGAYRAALGVNLASGFITFGLRIAIVPLFVTEGLSRGATWSGIAFLVAAAAQAVLLLPAGRLADQRGRRPALLAGSIALAVGVAILTAADLVTNSLGTTGAIGLVLFLLSMVIQGVSSAYLGSAPAAVVGDVMGGKRGGIVIGTFQMTSDLGMIIGPLLAGYLVDRLDFDWAFGAGLVLALGVVLLVWRMPETLQRSQPKDSA